MRERICINEGWHFHKGDIETQTPHDKGPMYSSAKAERMRWGPACVEYNDKADSYAEHTEFQQDAWQMLNLPHDYVIEETVSAKENNALGFFKYENAWYRKHLRFSADDRNKRITLFFEGVATQATVYFNGVPVARNYCGYTGFEADISDRIRFDADNVVAVYVNTQNHEGWWYEGGGIYRNVWLEKTDLTAIDRYGIFAHAHKVTEQNWELCVEITVNNLSYREENLLFDVLLTDAEGRIAASTDFSGNAAGFGKTEFKTTLQVENPHLWDIDDPYMYHTQVRLLKNGVPCDADSVSTGFRSFELNSQTGMILNGRHVKIFGVCMHEDCGLTGKAVPDNIHEYKIRMVKEMGANGYRCSHYPQSAAIMDSLDRQGFIVMAETRWFDSSEFGLKETEYLIKANRNRPSVFFWSLGNEESVFKEEQGKRIFQHMKAFVQTLDPTRPIMLAVDKEPVYAPVQKEVDVIGVNYHLDAFDELHKKYPDKPILSSECCATGSTRGWYYEDNPQTGHLNAFDKDTNAWFLGRERTFRFMMERDYIQGFFQWDSFEHRGEAAWPRICSVSGAIDLYLQKKDAFYQNQSHWTKQPMIHLLPHWNLPEFSGKKVKVWAYTNCDEAELVLNGESLGRIPIELYGHGEWFAEYVPGKLEVFGYKDGQKAAYDVRETTGKPCRLMLKLENSNFSQNGRDAAIITCYTVDETGRAVPDASPEVSFFTNQAAEIIGTGSDNCDHVPVKHTVRKMYAGRITVAVRLNQTEEIPELYAQADGYHTVCLSVRNP